VAGAPLDRRLPLAPVRSETAIIYDPLVIGATAITAASAATAGEEEDRILALVLAYPIRRSQLIIAKAAAIAAVVLRRSLARRTRGRLAGQERKPGGRCCPGGATNHGGIGVEIVAAFAHPSRRRLRHGLG
jgi:hypothetical protein